MIIQLKRILIAILLFGSIALSQVTEEEQTKIILADYVIQLDKEVKLNTNLTESINILIKELQAIENPSEELIAVLKKYNIYKGDNGDIPGKN